MTDGPYAQDDFEFEDVQERREKPAPGAYPLKRPRVRRNGFGRSFWTVEFPGRMTRIYCQTWRQAMWAVRSWHREQAQ